MEQNELIKKLESLQKVDHDALQSYDKALEKIDNAQLKNHLLQFRKDHERHIYSISDLLRAMGISPQSSLSGLKGMFLEKMTAIESMSGIEGVLKALEKGEQMTNDEYAEADTWFVDPKIHELLTSNCIFRFKPAPIPELNRQVNPEFNRHPFRSLTGSF